MLSYGYHIHAVRGFHPFFIWVLYRYLKMAKLVSFDFDQCGCKMMQAESWPFLLYLTLISALIGNHQCIYDNDSHHHYHTIKANFSNSWQLSSIWLYTLYGMVQSPSFNFQAAVTTQCTASIIIIVWMCCITLKTSLSHNSISLHYLCLSDFWTQMSTPGDQDYDHQYPWLIVKSKKYIARPWRYK